jgi:ethanolamine transporter EutH
MMGATTIFTILLGLAMLKKEDRLYIPLGIRCRALVIPVGAFVSCLLLSAMEVSVRPNIITPDGAIYGT